MIDSVQQKAAPIVKQPTQNTPKSGIHNAMNIPTPTAVPVKRTYKKKTPHTTGKKRKQEGITPPKQRQKKSKKTASQPKVKLPDIF